MQEFVDKDGVVVLGNLILVENTQKEYLYRYVPPRRAASYGISSLSQAQVRAKVRLVTSSCCKRNAYQLMVLGCCVKKGTGHKTELLRKINELTRVTPVDPTEGLLWP